MKVTFFYDDERKERIKYRRQEKNWATEMKESAEALMIKAEKGANESETRQRR